MCVRETSDKRYVSPSGFAGSGARKNLVLPQVAFQNSFFKPNKIGAAALDLPTTKGRV